MTFVRGSHRWPRSEKNRGEFHAPPDWLEPARRANPGRRRTPSSSSCRSSSKAGGASFHHHNRSTARGRTRGHRPPARADLAPPARPQRVRPGTRPRLLPLSQARHDGWTNRSSRWSGRQRRAVGVARRASESTAGRCRYDAWASPRTRVPRATGRPHARRRRRLVAAGLEVVVEQGAGDGAALPDEDYREAGAEVADGAAVAAADIIVRVGRNEPAEVAAHAPGQVLVGWIGPLVDPDLVQALAAAGVTAFGMESVPRVSRAQRMDALSSQATVAGYKAVLIAADAAAQVLPDADDRRRHRRRRPRCSCSAPASPACRRSRPPAGWAPSSRRSTRGRRSRSRSRAWARRSSSSRWTSARRPGRARLRDRPLREPAGAAAAAARAPHRRLGRRHHNGARPRPAGARLIPAERGGGDAPGLGDRRPGRRDRRQLRADAARRGRRGHGVTIDRHAQPAVRRCRSTRARCTPGTSRPCSTTSSSTARSHSTSRTRSPPTPSSPTTGGSTHAGCSGDDSVNESLLIELTVFVLAAFVGIEVISKVPTTLHTPLMSGTNAIHGVVIVGAILVAGADRGAADHGARHDRRRVRRLQRRRRLPRHRPDAATCSRTAGRETARMSKADWHRRRLPHLRASSSSSA